MALFPLGALAVVVVGAVSATAGYIAPHDTPHAANNVLFFAVDDMRPNIGAYNYSLVQPRDFVRNDNKYNKYY